MQKRIFIPILLMLIAVTGYMLQPISKAVIEYYVSGKEVISFTVEDDEVIEEPTQVPKSDQTKVEQKPVQQSLEQSPIIQQEDTPEDTVVFQPEIQAEAQEVKEESDLPEVDSSNQQSQVDKTDKVVTEINPELQENPSLDQNQSIMDDEYTGFEIKNIIRKIKAQINDSSFEVETIHIEAAEAFLTMIYEDGLWKLNAKGENESNSGAKIVRISGQSTTYQYDFKVNLDTSEMISVRRVMKESPLNETTLETGELDKIFEQTFIEQWYADMNSPNVANPDLIIDNE